MSSKMSPFTLILGTVPKYLKFFFFGLGKWGGGGFGPQKMYYLRKNLRKIWWGVGGLEGINLRKIFII